jgi:hypothetical protein
MRLLERLGTGIHGIVFAVESNAEFSALKVHYFREPYLREREIYERLTELEVSQILGFEVPRLLDFDDELLALRMAIVTPPFVLDFAGAYLDFPPAVFGRDLGGVDPEERGAIWLRLADGADNTRRTRTPGHPYARPLPVQYPFPVGAAESSRADALLAGATALMQAV